MKKKNVILILSLLLFISVSNHFSVYITYFTEGPWHIYYFETENAEFEHRTQPMKGSDLANMRRRFNIFLKNNPNTKDIIIYRTFRPNWFKFWLWQTYLSHPRYDYPYKTQR